MRELLNPGKYVVAVSGGVDSVVLLDMLTKDEKLELVVAHFDHGTRPDSAADAAFVKHLAAIYKLPFFCKRVKLGPGVGEALARQKRYDFLRNVRSNVQADAIITAHHQDDLIETALLNVIRGTKRLGIVSLQSTKEIKRPLLNLTKEQIKDYAQQHGLGWREDSTNTDLNYKRNMVRHFIKNSLTPQKRQKILSLLGTIKDDNKEIGQIVQQYLTTQPGTALDRNSLNIMDLPEAYEITAGWLRKSKVPFNKHALQRIVEGSKKLQNKSQIDVQEGYYCELSKDKITLKRR